MTHTPQPDSPLPPVPGAMHHGLAGCLKPGSSFSWACSKPWRTVDGQPLRINCHAWPHRYLDGGRQETHTFQEEGVLGGAALPQCEKLSLTLTLPSFASGLPLCGGAMRNTASPSPPNLTLSLGTEVAGWEGGCWVGRIFI